MDEQRGDAILHHARDTLLARQSALAINSLLVRGAGANVGEALDGARTHEGQAQHGADGGGEAEGEQVEVEAGPLLEAVGRVVDDPARDILVHVEEDCEECGGDHAEEAQVPGHGEEGQKPGTVSCQGEAGGDGELLQAEGGDLGEGGDGGHGGYGEDWAKVCEEGADAADKEAAGAHGGEGAGEEECSEGEGGGGEGECFVCACGAEACGEGLEGLVEEVCGDEAVEDIVCPAGAVADEVGRVCDGEEEEEEGAPDADPAVEGHEGDARARCEAVQGAGEGEGEACGGEDCEGLGGGDCVDDAADAGGEDALDDAEVAAGEDGVKGAEGGDGREAGEEHEEDYWDGL